MPYDDLSKCSEKHKNCAKLIQKHFYPLYYMMTSRNNEMLLIIESKIRVSYMYLKTHTHIQTQNIIN